MSPRSAESFDAARRWLDDAQANLEIERPATAATNAYYAILYAARAALSEEGRNPKTHSGAWALFGELFVASERFDTELYRRARRTEGRRLDLHYEAMNVSLDEARSLVADAEAFVAAVEALVE